MKETLEELKESISGIVGSFVIDEKGGVAAQDVPELMAGSVSKVSKTLHHVINVIKATKPIENMIIDSDNAKVIVMSANGRMFVVIAEKSINLPLFKLMSNMAISKIKEAPKPVTVKPSMPEVSAADTADIGNICSLYNQMFEVVAKKLTIIFGPGAAKMFDEKLKDAREKHPKLLENVGFEATGKPEISKLTLNASKVPKDELIEGLEAILGGMLEAVKSTAGVKVAEKALNETKKIKEDHKGEI